MSEFWVDATLFFTNQQTAQKWEQAFSLLKDTLWQEGRDEWQAGRDALVAMGCRCLAKGTEQDMPRVTRLEQRAARLDLTFAEGHVFSGDILNDISKAGATHISANFDNTQTFSTGTLYKIGNKKVKQAAFIESVSAFDDEYAFIQAVKKGNAKEIERLLAKGISPNAEVSQGWYAIHEAVDRKKSPIINLLMAAGADINVTTSYQTRWTHETGRTPVHLALNLRDERMVLPMLKKLLPYQPDLTIRDRGGQTPMDSAVAHQNLAAIDVLLSAGADINVRDEQGQTPVFHAWPGLRNQPVSNFLDFFDAMEARGVDFFATTNQGATLRWPHESNPIVRHYLEAKGVPFGRPSDAYTKTPIENLCTAISHYDHEKIREFISSGMDVNELIVDWSGEEEPVIHRAILHGQLDVVEWLLDAGAHVDAATTRNGETTLYKAARRGHAEIADLLIQRGADVNAVTNIKAPSKHGETPLMEAARGGFLDVVRLLVGRGADVNVATRHGETALMKAAHEGHLDVVRLLVEHGADVNARAMGISFYGGSPSDPFLRALETSRDTSDVLDYLFPLWKPTETEKSCGIKFANINKRQDWLEKIKKVPVSDK